MDLTPDFIKEEAVEEVVENLLPPNSKERYLKSYDVFMQWRAEKGLESFSENVLLTYFNELSKNHKSSTLWSVYSMLKATLSTKHNIHLKDFAKLSCFLKRQSDGFEATKSKVFTAHEVQTFLNQAPDEIYLVIKVVLILGISGACRSIELVNMTVHDIEKQGEIILVNLRGTKTKGNRTFIVKKELVQIIEKYQGLRPSSMETDRFFLNYQRGKCSRQVIGKNKMSVIPKQIATYLNLPNPNLYSGHCFRRTSATLLANTGADLTTIMEHGGLKSGKGAEGYIEESVESKTTISSKVTGTINLHTSERSSLPSTSKDDQEQNKKKSVPAEVNDKILLSPTFTETQDIQVSQKISNINIPGKNLSITFNNCSNFNINFK